MENIINSFNDVSASLRYENGRYSLDAMHYLNEDFIPLTEKDLDRVMCGPRKLVFASTRDMDMNTVTFFDCKTDITFKDVIDMIAKSETNIRKPRGKVWHEDHTFFEGGWLQESEEHGPVIMWCWGS